MLRLVVLTAVVACTFAGTISPAQGRGDGIRQRQALTPLSSESFLGGGGGRSFGGHGSGSFGGAFAGGSGFGKSNIGGSRGVIVDPLSSQNLNRNSIIGGKGGSLNAFNKNGYSNDGFSSIDIPYGGENFGAGNTLGGSFYGDVNQNIASPGFNKANSVTSRGYGNNVFGDRKGFAGDRGFGGAVFGGGYSSGVGLSKPTGYNGINGGSSLGKSSPFSSDSILGNTGFGNQDLYDVGVAGAGRGDKIYGGFDASGVIGADSGYAGGLNGKRGIIGGTGYNAFGRDNYGLGGQAGGINAFPSKGSNILDGNGYASGSFGGKSFSGKGNAAFGNNLYRK